MFQFIFVAPLLSVSAKMPRARILALAEFLDTDLSSSGASENQNGNPIEINGLINSKSNETQMKPK